MSLHLQYSALLVLSETSIQVNYVTLIRTYCTPDHA